MMAFDAKRARREASVGFMGAVLLAFVLADTPCLAALGGTEIDDGHVDIGVVCLDEPELWIIRDDAMPLRPAAARFVLRANTMRQVRAQPGYEFLGSDGSHVWVTGDGLVEGEPFIGFAGAACPDFPLAGSVMWLLVGGISGPGHVVLFQKALALKVYVDTRAGIKEDIPLAASGHDHYVWAFSEPGHYTIQLSLAGFARESGEPHLGRAASFVFDVHPPALALDIQPLHETAEDDGGSIFLLVKGNKGARWQLETTGDLAAGLWGAEGPVRTMTGSGSSGISLPRLAPAAFYRIAPRPRPYPPESATGGGEEE